MFCRRFVYPVVSNSYDIHPNSFLLALAEGVIRVLAEVWRAGQHPTTLAHFFSAPRIHRQMSVTLRNSLPTTNTYRSSKLYLLLSHGLSTRSAQIRAVADFRGIAPSAPQSAEKRPVVCHETVAHSRRSWHTPPTFSAHS